MIIDYRLDLDTRGWRLVISNPRLNVKYQRPETGGRRMKSSEQRLHITTHPVKEEEEEG